MKNKFLIALLIIICAVCCVFAFTACDTDTPLDEGNQTEQGSNTDDDNKTEQDGNTDDGNKTEQGSNFDDGKPEQEGTQGLIYSLSYIKTSYSVTGLGTATDTDIVIPSRYNNLPVTYIEYSAFEKCTSLTSIVIPNSVTSIGSWAFRDCTSLTSIKFNGTVDQWRAIEEQSSWDGNTGEFTVTCSDGTVTK